MKRRFCALLAALLALSLCACAAPAEENSPPTAAESPGEPTATPKPGETYLYGEEHSNGRILDMELERWQGYYEGGMRHLFIEYGYSTAQLLNLWMGSEDDSIFEEFYESCAGTQAHSQYVYDWFMSV